MANQLKAIKILSELVKEISESSGYHVNISLNKAHLIGYLEAIEELEHLQNKDKLAELEKVILDYYLALGYKIGIGGWAFKVLIKTGYKKKRLIVYFRESESSSYKRYFYIDDKTTTKDMFDEVIEYFKVNKKDL